MNAGVDFILVSRFLPQPQCLIQHFPALYPFQYKGRDPGILALLVRRHNARRAMTGRTCCTTSALFRYESFFVVVDDDRLRLRNSAIICAWYHHQRGWWSPRALAEGDSILPLRQSISTSRA